MKRGSLQKIKDSVEFLPHQIVGVRKLARVPSFMLLDDMGLGKSLQALTVAAIAFEMGHARRVLVVCPATLKGNWAQEIEDHTNFTYTILDGTPDRRAKQIEAADATDFLICSYEQAVNHVAWTEPVLDKNGKVRRRSRPEGANDIDAFAPDILIVDEAHMAKNRDSKRTMATMRLPGRRTFLLTGSPVLNQADDLWTLLNRVEPMTFPNYWTYRNRYLVFGGFKGKVVVGVKNEAELRAHVDRLSLRRRFDEVFDIKQPVVVPVHVDLSDEQRRLYDEIKNEQRMTLPGELSPRDIENALVKFLRLKEVCGTTAAIDEALGDHSTKLDRTVEIIVELIEAGEPVVVFTQFRKVLECLVDRLERRRIEAFQLHGDVPQKDRIGVIRQWNQACDITPSVICCMYQVAGVGLNMTRARKVVRIDRLFVPKLNDQAVSRCLRIGSDFSQAIQVFDITARRTVEQRIEQINKRKRKVADAISGDDPGWKRELVRAVLDNDDDLIPDVAA